VLGDLRGLGIDSSDIDKVGYVRTATEVSPDNSALMRNVKKHEIGLQSPIVDVSYAVLASAHAMGERVLSRGISRSSSTIPSSRTPRSRRIAT